MLNSFIKYIQLQFKNSFAKGSQFLFLVSFVVPITIGTLLFKIPGVYKGELSWFNAAYMATSSVCVTGLAVVPVSEFSFWGQLVMILLVQLGGLGIITISAWLVLLSGRHFSFDERLMMSPLNDDFSMRNSEKLIKLIVKYTLICEAAGMVVIFAGCMVSGESFFAAFWHAIFIAVASFCNAGFSPYPDSVMSMSWISQLGSSLMILTGSLGIYVIYDFIQRAIGKRCCLRAHSKLVLLATGVLLLFSTITLYLLENKAGNFLSLFNAYYMSVSGCSAGFNSVNISEFTNVSRALIMFLMLVGGAPGSTAGGLKISTVAVAIAAIWNTVAGNRQVTVFKRAVPMDNVMKAFAVIFLFGILVIIGSVAVVLSNNYCGSPQRFDYVLFESVSAICTVGLSLGDTSTNINEVGKLIIMILMYIGRIGPLTLLLFLLAREKPGKVSYPEERIIIG